MFTSPNHYLNRTPELNKTVTVSFEGQSVTVPAGISVAAAVLGHTLAHHTSINGVAEDPRAPYCLMGVCFECMVEINGRPNQQACLITVEDGMEIKRQTELVGTD